MRVGRDSPRVEPGRDAYACHGVLAAPPPPVGRCLCAWRSPWKLELPVHFSKSEWEMTGSLAREQTAYGGSARLLGNSQGDLGVK